MANYTLQRGAILYHTNFKFKNGDTGKKLLILLNNPKINKPYLFVKTTSQDKNKSREGGCNIKLGLFYIPASTSYFDKDTWVQLYELYEFNVASVVKDNFDGHLNIVNQLSEQLFNEVKNCIKVIPDISTYHKKLIGTARSGRR